MALTTLPAELFETFPLTYKSFQRRTTLCVSEGEVLKGRCSEIVNQTSKKFNFYFSGNSSKIVY